MNYFNFYPGDYLRDTTRLTMAQNGAFLSLLCAYYSEAAPLPANDTAIFLICKAATKAEQRDALLVADKYFPIGDDGLRHNARADFEIEKAKPRIESARQNGSKGGRPRKPSGLSERNPVGYQRKTHSVICGFVFRNPRWCRFRSKSFPSKRRASLRSGCWGQAVILRDYQTAAVNNLRASLARGNRSPLLTAPTGSGKTIIARALVEGANAKGKRVLFLAPRRELIFQTCEKLESAGIPYGVLMAGQVPRPWEPVQVACVPTLTTRCLRNKTQPLPKADLLIVDEAHWSIAQQTRALLDAYPEAVKVGLTATPARADGRGLGAMYDDLVLGPSVAELTAQGHLAPVRYFAPTKPDLAKVKIVRGDYDQTQLGHRMDDPKLVGDIVANWARIAPTRKTVVFAVNVSHSMHLRDRFLELGVNAEHLDGATPKEQRAAMLQRLRSGETQVLCN